MKRFFMSTVVVLMALCASAATTITVADYDTTSFTTIDRHFAITAAKDSSTTAPGCKAGVLVIPAKGSLTIEAASEMTEIVLSIPEAGVEKLGENTADCGTLVTDKENATVKWTGNSKKVVIVVADKNTIGGDGSANAQLRLTALSIEGGTEGTLAGPMYTIDFRASKAEWTIDNKTIPSELSYIWQQDSKYGYKASAYANKTTYAAESWLISPVFDLQGHNTTSATLNFNQALNKGKAEDMHVKITKDGATWEDLTIANWPAGTDWVFIESGEVDITAYISDKTQFAFVYTSTTTSAATWEIDKVTLSGDGEPFEKEEVHIKNTPETAYTVSEAIALIDAGEGLLDTVYVKGKVDSIGELLEQYRNVGIEITDGTNKMLAYGCFGLNRDSIMSQAELDAMVKVGDEVVVVGTMKKFGNIYEFNAGCWLYSVESKMEESIKNALKDEETAEKFFRNGVMIIRRNGVEYNAMGTVIE